MTRWLRLLGVVFALGLLFAACSDDSGDDDGGSDAASDDGGGDCGTAVCMQDSTFVPDSTTVAVGDSVEWTNLDGIAHTVTADDDAFDSGELDQDGTYEETFDEAGEFTYHCEIHPSMTGTITVE
jgi:plastocyanin